MRTGDRIRARREALGMTQAELAERTGITLQAISLWEQNKLDPGIGSLCKLADMLGVTVDYLCTHDSRTGAYATGNKMKEQENFTSEELSEIYENFNENIIEQAPEIVMKCRNRIDEAIESYLEAIEIEMFRQAFTYGYNCGKNGAMGR